MNKKYILFLIIFFIGCPPPQGPVDIDHSLCELDGALKDELREEGSIISASFRDHFLGEFISKDFYIQQNAQGEWYTDGDILLPISLYQPKNGLSKFLPFPDLHEKEEHKALSILPASGGLWPNGVVPFYIDTRAIPQTSKIYEAMDIWEEVTDGVIQFRPWQPEDENFLVFERGIDDYECSSFVGMIGGYQWITLSPLCDLEVTVHEIGHALGLWHEHSRSDRDSFVEILWCNIKGDLKYNFLIEPQTQAVDIGDYDFNSIMHYHSTAFAIDYDKPTLKSKIPGIEVPYSRGSAQPSTGDIHAIRCLYDPDVTCDFRW